MISMPRTQIYQLFSSIAGVCDIIGIFSMASIGCVIKGSQSRRGGTASPLNALPMDTSGGNYYPVLSVDITSRIGER